MTNPPTIEVAIAVVENAGRFLVGRRGSQTVLAGKAEFPGGKVEPGESASAAAVRECCEETGLTVEVEFEYPPTVHDYDHGRLSLRFFACRLATAPTVAPQEPYRWVERAELEKFDFPAANRDLLRRLAAVDSRHQEEIGKRTS